MVERPEVRQEQVKFPGAGIELEGVLHLPRADRPLPAVVVCHPHPLYGGDMHNNVVLAVCQALGRASMAAFRFNFRGVGKSQGVYDNGVGEQTDLVAALAFLESASGVDTSRIGLAGYSFSTGIAARAAPENEKVRALALISPFLAASEWEHLRSYRAPKLFLCGTHDDFISSEELKRSSGGLPEPTRCEIIQRADHFWWGYEGEVAERVAAFFRAAFSG
ncbi:MAG: alpha/beta hydrolase [Chloroflexi bacterium]|nr:alpha/beta hydrolase [Chloroflexota bacterium]